MRGVVVVCGAVGSEDVVVQQVVGYSGQAYAEYMSHETAVKVRGAGSCRGGGVSGAGKRIEGDDHTQIWRAQSGEPLFTAAFSQESWRYNSCSSKFYQSRFLPVPTTQQSYQSLYNHLKSMF